VQVATLKSTIHCDSTYTIPSTVELDGPSLTLSKVGLIKETQLKYELLHFGYLAQWKSFRGVVVSRQLFLQEDTSLLNISSSFAIFLLPTVVMSRC
jgi:hypothetical protein